MSSTMTRCLIAGMVVALMSGPSLTGAEEVARAKAAKPAPPTFRRGVYPVQSGLARDLALTLARQFQGNAEIQSGPETTNCLLISAPAPVYEEILKVLEQIDRKPHTVNIEVLFGEISQKKRADGKPEPSELKERDLAGPLAEVQEKLQALEKKGVVVGLKRIRLTAMENQKTQAEIRESKPMVVGATISGGGGFGIPAGGRGTGGGRGGIPGGGPVSEGVGAGRGGGFVPGGFGRGPGGGPGLEGVGGAFAGGRGSGMVLRNIIYRDTGTTVRVTPSVAPGHVVLLKLEIQDARLHVPEDGIEFASPPNAVTPPDRAAEIINLSVLGTFRVNSGQAQVIQGIKTNSSSGKKQSLVIVTASVVD